MPNVARSLLLRTLAETDPEIASAVANEVRQGWRIESQTDYQAVIVRGHRPNHDCT